MLFDIWIVGAVLACLWALNSKSSGVSVIPESALFQLLIGVAYGAVWPFVILLALEILIRGPRASK